MTLKKIYSTLIFVTSISFGALANEEHVSNSIDHTKMIISSSVVDILKHPGVTNEQDSEVSFPILAKDTTHVTQLLFGERVIAQKEKGDWIQIRAIEQEVFTAETGWTKATGWINKSQAIPVESFPSYNISVTAPWTNIYKKPDRMSKVFTKVCAGTKLKGVRRSDDKQWIFIKLPNQKIGAIRSEDVCIKRAKEIKPERKMDSLRNSIVQIAKNFLGTPYCFGGRSVYSKDKPVKKILGVDCSGLVNISYSANGLAIPRTSHAQFLKSSKIKSDVVSHLKPADLIFSASKKNPQKINHVMMYAGNNQIIEATSMSGNVRIINASKRLGKSIDSIKYGHVTRNTVYYFGSILDQNDLTHTSTHIAVVPATKEETMVHKKSTKTKKHMPVKSKRKSKNRKIQNKKIVHHKSKRIARAGAASKPSKAKGKHKKRYS